MTTPTNAQPFIDWFFENNGAALLGQAVGLDAETTQRALKQGLPMQLQALAEHANTRLGDHQISEAIAAMPPFPSVMEALSMGRGASDLERAGETLAPTLLRDAQGSVPVHVGGVTGADRTALERLFHMTLPLILSRLNWRDAVALPVLPLVGQHKRVPGDVLIPTNAAVAAGRRTALAAAPAAVVTERNRVPWWLWPLAFLLLLLLGGCLYGMYRTPDNIKDTMPAQVQPAGNQAFTVTTPAPGTEVSANGFTLAGTGTAEERYTIWRGGQQVGVFTADKDGRWKTDVLDGAVPAGDVLYTFRDASNNAVGSLNVKARGPEAGVTPVELIAPPAGSDVSAGGFAIQGKGAPNATYTAFEDGANIGSVTAGPDGTWGVNVAGASAGNHTYTVLDAAGNRVLLLPLNVVSGNASASCTDPLSISLNDNSTVSAPFRFGGRGGGKGYTVTVWRGAEQIGTRDVKLSGDCTWSYASDPGGKDGQPATIRYEVRPLGTGTGTPATGQVNLTVSGSGTNFQNGEYVGPTDR